MSLTVPTGSVQSSSFDRPTESSGSDSRLSFDDEPLPHRVPARWSRVLSLIPSLKSQHGTGRYAYDYQPAPTEDDLDRPSNNQPNVVPLELFRLRILRGFRKMIYRLPLLILMAFGVLHILLVMLGRKSLAWDHHSHNPNAPGWDKELVGFDASNYPTDTTQNIIPIPCHSHNDYWRKVPLFDALSWGFTSVEADVWLFDGHEELLVGHNTASLRHDRTFKSLYVDPLLDLLDKMNTRNEYSNTTDHGIFDADPQQTLILLVDFKTDGHDLFPHVQHQLEPLRAKNYLTYWNGNNITSRAITVVGTGNTPFDSVVANSTYRDIFFDAPLDEFWATYKDPLKTDKPSQKTKSPRLKARACRRSPSQGQTGTSHIQSAAAFNTSNSYYASVSFLKTIGMPWSGRLTTHQLERIRGQIRGARQQGLKARYWDTPAWPTSLRNYIWQTLVEEGAEMLNVDDLEAAAKLDWTMPPSHQWFDA